LLPISARYVAEPALVQKGRLQAGPRFAGSALLVSGEVAFRHG
jgi:hypothetical protein